MMPALQKQKILNFSFWGFLEDGYKRLVSLLAPQSGAHRRGDVNRDVHPIRPIPFPHIAFDHLSHLGTLAFHKVGQRVLFKSK